MIERLIEYSIRNRFVVLAIAAAMAIWGIHAILDTPVDAIPDLGENQVIVFTDWMGRSPREIEDQVTYPLSRALQGLAGVKAVRSTSEFNFSMITIIFEDGVDFYFARQRVTEKLQQGNTFLPAGVVPYLAPDATALGQVFWYTVEPSPSNPMDPQRLWALNKFYIVLQLKAAAGVADVATVGGTPLEYQVDVRPEALRAYGITLGELFSAVSESNMPAGGGVVQKNSAEFIVRGIGWIKDKGDIENTVIREVNGTPIYVRNVATVQLGTQFRRSVFEKDGSEVVGGVVLMRHGENPLAVTGRVKRKIQELQPGLPRGVRLVPAYDRTRLVKGAIHTLTEVMWHEMAIASVAILLILTHVRSVFVICVTLPLSVLFSFLAMWFLRKAGIIDIQANIMSLAGITISIGILVDQAIVMTENATHALKERFGDKPVVGDTREWVIPACRLVGRPIFFSVMIMLVSFIPVFMLTGREGKYFHPLAFTKSFAMAGVALISVTVVPALIPGLIRGRLRSEEENWIVRGFIHVYRPLLTWALPRRNLVMWMFAALLILASGIFPVQAVVGLGASEAAWRTMFLLVFLVVTALTVAFTRGLAWQAASLATLLTLGLWTYGIDRSNRIGVEFMPPLDEGSIMDMPVTVPRASVTQAADDLKHRDGLLRGFPEVESVIGKVGRADTPTDPAPLDMVETFVNFRPRELWPRRVLGFQEAARQAGDVLSALEAGGFVARAPGAEDRVGLVNDSTQKALELFDETMRDLALLRYREVERGLGPELTRFAVAETIRRFRLAGDIQWPPGTDEEGVVDDLARQFTQDFGPWLARNPALEDAGKLALGIARGLHERGALRAEYRLTPRSFADLRLSKVPQALAARLSELSEKSHATEKDFLAALRKVMSPAELGRHKAALCRHALTQIEPAAALAIRNPFLGPGSVSPWALVATALVLLALFVLLPWKAAFVACPLGMAASLAGFFLSGHLGPRHFAHLESQAAEFLGREPATFAGELQTALENRRMALWRGRVKEINWELHDRGCEAFTWYAMTELVRGAGGAALLREAPHGRAAELFAAETVKARLGKPHDPKAMEPFAPVREALEKPFRDRVFLWPRKGGKEGDLVADEMNRVLQVPGWSNIFTMPIVNRIDMLSTGVRTDIGVKVFGPDLATVDKVSRDIESVLKPITGASDVIASPIMGKGYVEIEINREKAARYGISVEDIQTEVEVALGGRVITHTVEKRDRFPVRVRYARSHREDETSVRRLLISTGSLAAAPGMEPASGAMAPSRRPNDTGASVPTPRTSALHKSSPGHSARGTALIPLSAVADVRIVEGPAMIRSENGRLNNTVTLNVRGRDMLGFVDEAQRVVAQKVVLPEGVSISWSGEFEHQVRAARTLRLVFPAVIALIFLILYMTYQDLADASLMMLAVPEAMAGGIFFLWIFPKVMHGWDAPPLDFSVAVWVGFIACFGMATETGIIMLVYLREAIEKRGGLENIKSLEELRQAVIEGAVHRLRPKLLTEGVAIIAIFPMVFAQGVGGEILAPMALPVLGGLLIADEVVDIFLPVRFYWVRRARWLKLMGDRHTGGEPPAEPLAAPPAVTAGA